MSKGHKGHRRGGKGAAAKSQQLLDNPPPPPECLCLTLHLTSSQLDEQLQEGCPVPLQLLAPPPPPQQQHEQQQEELEELDQQQQHVATLQLESWSQLPAVLQWFGSSVVIEEPTAKLAFTSCLPKELRADVHTCVSKKCSKQCQSVSEGLGEQRYVAVVAKGAIKPACRRMTGEQQDHAMALWLLWKQHSKNVVKQLQRQQQQHQQLQAVDEQVQQQQQRPEAAASSATDVTHAVQSMTLLEPAVSAAGGEGVQQGVVQAATATASGCSEPGSDAAASQPPPQAPVSCRVYSRDEIGQMLQQDALTDELSALWRGPQGVQQRAVRLLCLAAAAGDVQELQELVAAHPQLLPSAVADLSGGGSLPLHLAAASGCVATVQALLAAGAPLEAKDGKGQTALQVAQRSEQCDVEAVLMQAGAVNSQKDSWGTLDMPGGFL